jgi:hypothetical protein
MALPECDELFLKFFTPWYPEKDRARSKGTKGDMITIGDLVGHTASEVSRLTEEWQVRAMGAIDQMHAALLRDWPRYLPVSGKVDIGWVKAFDEYYDEVRIAELIERSDPGEDGNDYMIVAIEFGVVLGHVLRQYQPRMEWCPDMPYWESAIFDSKTGTLIPVVHWAVKKLSGYGWDDGFVAKIGACSESLDKNEA